MEREREPPNFSSFHPCSYPNNVKSNSTTNTHAYGVDLMLASEPKVHTDGCKEMGEVHIEPE